MAHERTIAGFVLAGLACGDATGERVLGALAPPLRMRARAALEELSTLRGSDRVAFLRLAAPRANAVASLRPGAPRGLSRAVAASAEPDRTADELSLLAEAGWLG